MRANRIAIAAQCARTPHAADEVRRTNASLLLAAAFLLLTVLASSGHGQCIDYDDYPQWAGAVGTPTQTQEIVIAGDYAYMTGAFPPGLLVADISDPVAPEVVSFLEMGSWTINGLAVYQNYVYVANGSNGLQVVDVTNPTAPAIAGNWDGSLSVVSDVLVYGQYLCVAGTGGLRILDISAPTSPVEIGSLSMSIDWYGGMAAAGGNLYIANGWSGLSIVSLANMAAPTILNTLPTGGVAGDVVVSGSTAYVANGDAGVSAVYVASPATAYIMWAVDTPGSARDLSLLGSYLLVADNASGLTVIDRRSAFPTVHRTLDGPGATVAIAIRGSQAFLAAQEYGIQVADIRNYAGVGRLDTEKATSVCVQGNYAYVGDWSAGLKVVDVSDPSRPTLVGSVARQAWEAAYVTVAGDYLYWADKSDGLLIVDISIPANPTIVRSLDLRPSDATNFVAVQGNYAYFPRGTYGLHILDVSNPTQAIPNTLLDTPGTANGLVVDGDFAYLADMNMGLQIIDISDPLNATIVGNLTTPMNAVEVHRNRNTIYVHETNNYIDNQIEAFDISSPGQPVRQGSFATSVRTKIFGFSGQFMYISYINTAGGYCGFAPVDISDPYNLPDHPVPYTVMGGAVANDLVYLNAYLDGLVIFPIGCDATYAAPVPDPGSLLPSAEVNITSLHPNPFNPEVQIDYELREPGPVTLEIYDVQGRHVQSHPLGQREAGHHVATWNGTDRSGRTAPSGVYLIRMRSAGATSPSKKVVMLD